MDQVETLSLIAQLAIALVGFSGLVAVFSKPDGGTWNAGAKFRLRVLIEGGLVVTFMALMPLVLQAFNLSGPRLWQIACAIYFLIFASTFATSAHRFLAMRRNHTEQISMLVGVIQWSLAFGSIALSALGALNLWPDINSGFFITALSLQLGMPAISFLAMVVGSTDDKASAK